MNKTMRFIRNVAVVAIVAFVFVGAASAMVIPGLFNTGVQTTAGIDADTSNTPGQFDNHWNIVGAPAGELQCNGPEAWVLQGSPTAGPWLPNSSSPNSVWLSGRDAASGVALGGAGSAGNYKFQTSFNLTGLPPSGVAISIRAAADDAITDILINGVSTGLSASGFGSFTTFNLNATAYPYFLASNNTIAFIVNNSSTSPMGFRAEFLSGTASVPEPSTLVLLGLGLGGMLFTCRKTENA